MGVHDKKIDAYIANAPEFARPILRELRDIVHQACPAVEEAIKWGCPHFTYRGMLCSMAAFKQHCAFGFWKSKLILPTENQSEEAMGQFGRITSRKDLPSRKALLGYVKKAAELNEKGVKLPRSPRPSASEKKDLKVPAYFESALKDNREAQNTFSQFPYSHKKEYVEWITEAKTDQTRRHRVLTSIAWLAEGKSRNWKYER